VNKNLSIKYLNSVNASSSWVVKLIIILLNLSCGSIIANIFPAKVLAAEEIYLDYGPLEFSLSVKYLDIYAKEGAIKGDLAAYAGYLNQEQLAKLKVALNASVDLNSLAIAQFLYSYQGEKILERVGRVVQTQSRQSGFYAIRSALILAAAEREGLTPLNILKKFPTRGIRINSQQGFKIIEDVSSILQETNRAIARVERKAIEEGTNNSQSNISVLPNLLEPGQYQYRRQLLTMRDRQRKRIFPVDLYLPQSILPVRLPLIVISHGLGGDRTTFDYLAKHLASYGFAVAVPEHPGSNASQIQALLNGFANKVTPPRELIDRPLDIKYLLDALETDYGEQINVERVGIIGQSFGAYTALAVAGAEINWNSLQSNCENLDDSWNLSLLLQCLALELPKSELKLKDDRIVSAIAINPLTSAIFSKTGLERIKIPVMFMSGSSDPITPALTEQIDAFNWLNDSDKYLALLKGATHFSTLNESAGSIPVPAQAIGPNPKIAQDYVKQLSLAFFGVYVTHQNSYQAYLNSDYAASISERAMPLSLVKKVEFSQFAQ
jgi:predicted dienelactone hydrolase